MNQNILHVGLLADELRQAPTGPLDLPHKARVVFVKDGK